MCGALVLYLQRKVFEIETNSNCTVHTDHSVEPRRRTWPGQRRQISKLGNKSPDATTGTSQGNTLTILATGDTILVYISIFQSKRCDALIATRYTIIIKTDLLVLLRTADRVNERTDGLAVGRDEPKSEKNEITKN